MYESSDATAQREIATILETAVENCTLHEVALLDADEIAVELAACVQLMNALVLLLQVPDGDAAHRYLRLVAPLRAALRRLDLREVIQAQQDFRQSQFE